MREWMNFNTELQLSDSLEFWASQQKEMELMDTLQT